MISDPLSSIVPRSGARRPEITSNRVVLPAPLGPMMPCTSPRSTDMDTSLNALTPPKLTKTPWTPRATSLWVAVAASDCIAWLMAAPSPVDLFDHG